MKVFVNCAATTVAGGRHARWKPFMTSFEEHLLRCFRSLHGTASWPSWTEFQPMTKVEKTGAHRDKIEGSIIYQRKNVDTTQIDAVIDEERPTKSPSGRISQSTRARNALIPQMYVLCYVDRTAYNVICRKTTVAFCFFLRPFNTKNINFTHYCYWKINMWLYSPRCTAHGVPLLRRQRWLCSGWRPTAWRPTSALLVRSSPVAKAVLVRCEALSNGAKLCNPDIVLVIAITDQARSFQCVVNGHVRLAPFPCYWTMSPNKTKVYQGGVRNTQQLQGEITLRWEAEWQNNVLSTLKSVPFTYYLHGSFADVEKTTRRKFCRHSMTNSVTKK